MLHQTVSLKQQHKILPNQIELLNLMYLPNLEMEQKILTEINENPFLEPTLSEEDESNNSRNKDQVQDFQNWEEYGYDDIPDYKTEYNNYLSTEKIPELPLTELSDFREEVKKQLRFLSLTERQVTIGDFIIDSCNDTGFLDISISSITDDLSFKNNIWVEDEEIEEVLKKIQVIEPVGVGSRNIREFYLIQLKHELSECRFIQSAVCLFENHFDDLQKRNWNKIKDDICTDREELEELLHFISGLRTKPVNESSPNNNFIVPDFIITIEEDELKVSLYKAHSSQLGLNAFWVEKAKNMQKDNSTDTATKHYFKNKLSSAQWFMDAVKQRETNMLKIMSAIARYQKEYFLTGDIMYIKPMVLKDIADITGLDISTVSRVTCNKFVSSYNGNVLLKSLFSEALSTVSGDEISSKVVQSLLQQIVASENKLQPYTDQELTALLSSRGYVIARRTVSKYREKLRIPVGYLRSGSANFLNA